jgi:hypothetical protein
MWESLAPVILTDFEHAKSEISRIIQHYDSGRKHSSLHYLIPVNYYGGDPDVILAIREAKVEKERTLGRERNMKERKGDETAGTVS